MYNNTKSFKFSKITYIFLLFAIVIAPLYSMIKLAINYDIKTLFMSRIFHIALKNSILVAAVTTVTVIFLSLLFAWLIVRKTTKLSKVFYTIASIPMIIPSISHSMGLVFILGNNGILTNLFKLPSFIYGFKGIVLGSILYTFPIALIMFTDVLRYEDSSPYDAAKVLGIPKRFQFFSISLPFLLKPMISIAFAVFAMVMTDYGVPLVVGGHYQTLAGIMYNEVVGLLNFDKGSFYGLILLFPAIIAFLTDLFSRNASSDSTIMKKNFNINTKLENAFSNIFCGTVSFLLVLPILSFFVLAFVKKYPIDLTITLDHFKRSIEMGMGKNFLHSVFVAVFVAIIGTISAYFIAYLTARTTGKLSKILHLFCMSLMSVPGLVLGLSYSIYFRNSAIYNTFIILIIVNTMHFFASPYLMAYNSLKKLNSSFESVGAMLGISKIYIIKDIIIPQTKETMLEMGYYFFVNSMMTISAVSFLTTIDTMPVSLMIPRFEAQMLLESSAVVSIVILFSNLIARIIKHLINLKMRAKEYDN